LGVAIVRTHAYVADEASGLLVIDISNPASPQIVASVDTPGFAFDVAVAGNHAYVADGLSPFNPLAKIPFVLARSQEVRQPSMTPPDVRLYGLWRAT
jgi:hypothetical protein